MIDKSVSTGDVRPHTDPPNSDLGQSARLLLFDESSRRGDRGSNRLPEDPSLKFGAAKLQPSLINEQQSRPGSEADRMLRGFELDTKDAAPVATVETMNDAKNAATNPGDDSAVRAKVNAIIEHTKENTKGWDSMMPPDLNDLRDKIGDSRLLYWGNVHEDKQEGERFKNALGELKKSGVDTVAMEGFGQDQQKLMDNWLNSKSGSEQEKEFESQIRDYLNKTIPIGQSWTDKIVGVLYGIKGEGLKVVCPEPNGPPITAGGAPVDRDKEWNNVVQQHLKDHPNSRMVLSAGAAHFMKNLQPTGAIPFETIADHLAQDKVKTVDLTPPSQYIIPR